jgi:hypothetical protein
MRVETMRRMLCLALLAAAVSPQGYAQGASVTIQNEEVSTFYYVVDPQELAQVTPGSPLAATNVAAFFAAQAEQPQFTPLAPGAQATLTGLSDGPHLLLGFFAVDDPDSFPVRLITLQADSSMGDRFYSIYGSPALVQATRGVGRLAQFARSSTPEQASAQSAPPAEEQRAASAMPAATPAAQPAPQAPAPAVPSEGTVAPAAASPTPVTQAQRSAPTPAAVARIASFSESYNPAYFTRETQGDFSVQPIADSRTWTLSGTHITSLSANIDESTLTVSLTTGDDFSPNVSYFIYAFTTRAPGATATFTLELRPRALPDRGACILWLNQQGTAIPTIFGSVKVEGKTATLVADLKDEPASLGQAISCAGSFDLTSCSFDVKGGVYEEFYFATIAMADIPVIR